MVYVNLGTNATGQRLIGCRHMFLSTTIDMFHIEDGSTVYNVRTAHSRFIFVPSHKTIVLWCDNCYGGIERSRIIGTGFMQSAEREAAQKP